MLQNCPTLRRASSETRITAYFPLAALPSPKPVRLDEKKSQAFLSRITRALNDAATCIELSLGYQLKLVEVVHDKADRQACEIAKELNLSPRYVEEWLAGIKCANMAIPENAGLTSIIPAMARAEGELIQAFRDGQPARLREVDELARGLYPKAEELLKLYPGLGDGAHIGVVGGTRSRLVEEVARLAEGSWFSMFSDEKGKSGGNVHWCDWEELSGLRYLHAVLVIDGAEVGRRKGCLKQLGEALKIGGVLLYVDICGGGGAFSGALGLANGGCGSREIVEKNIEAEGFDIVDVHTVSNMSYVIVAMMMSASADAIGSEIELSK